MWLQIISTRRQVRWRVDVFMARGNRDLVLTQEIGVPMRPDAFGSYAWELEGSTYLSQALIFTDRV